MSLRQRCPQHISLLSLKDITAHLFVTFARKGDDMVCTGGFIISQYTQETENLPPSILFVNPISQ